MHGFLFAPFAVADKLSFYSDIDFLKNMKMRELLCLLGKLLGRIGGNKIF